MGELLLYIIKAGVYITVFYLFYKLLLGHATFFRLNRWVLLGGAGICLLLPFMEPTLETERFIHLPMRTVEKFLLQDKAVTEDIPAVWQEAFVLWEESEGFLLSQRLFRWDRFLFYSYCGGVFVIALVFGLSFQKMFSIVKRSRLIYRDSYQLYITNEAVCSFSWCNLIILTEHDYHTHPEEILTHELCHVKYRHSTDLIVAHLFTLFFWFVPAIWLWKRELQELHEYEADQGVINQGIDASKYQLLLVKKAVGARLYSMANGFNHSKLKNRINMMLKEKTSRWARLRLLVFLPVMVVVVFAFGRTELTVTLLDYLQQDPVLKKQLLEVEFQEQLNSYKKQSGRELSFLFLDHPGKLRYEAEIGKKVADVFPGEDGVELYVNALNRILFGGELIEVADLNKALLNRALALNGKPLIVYVMWDRGSNAREIDAILGELKKASLEAEAHFGRGDGKTLSKEEPAMVVVVRRTGESLREEHTRYEGFVLDFYGSDNEIIETITDFTVPELKLKIEALREENKIDDMSVVSLSVPKNSLAGEVSDIKEGLRGLRKVSYYYEQ